MTNQSAKLTLLTIAFLCSSALIACLSFSHQAILLVPSVVILLALFPLIALNSPSLEGPSNHQDVSPLEESILGYMNDDNAHYAISLYGEWGSGKTWFCDNRLKGLLKHNGFSLCRVSLFGWKATRWFLRGFLPHFYPSMNQGQTGESKTLSDSPHDSFPRA